MTSKGKNADFSRAVEQLRQFKGLNKREMAKACKMKETHYSDCVAGRKGFTLNKMKEIAKLTGTTMIAFFIDNYYFEK